jgi:hypothetical protein
MRTINYNWVTFGTWEFHLRRHAGYLGDVDFFNRKLGMALENEEEDDRDDSLFNSATALAGDMY